MRYLLWWQPVLLVVAMCTTTAALSPDFRADGAGTDRARTSAEIERVTDHPAGRYLLDVSFVLETGEVVHTQVWASRDPSADGEVDVMYDPAAPEGAVVVDPGSELRLRRPAAFA